MIIMIHKILFSLKPLAYFSLIVIYIYIIYLTKQKKKSFLTDVGIALVTLLLLRFDYVAFKLTIVFLFFTLSIRNIGGKLSAFLLSLLQTLFLSLSLVEAAYYCATEKWMGEAAIFAIYQTHWSEAKSYLISHPEYLAITFFAFLLLIIFYIINQRYNTKGTVSPTQNCSFYGYTVKNTYLFIFLAVLSCLLGRHVIRHAEAYQAYQSTKNFFRQIEERVPPQDLIATAKEKKNIVIIIGESANRDYYSCYGFPYPTTPWLDSQKANPNCLFIQNAYACNKFTGKVLPMALSEQNQYNNMPFNQTADLIDVLHKTGYTVYWISNQGMINNIAEGFQYMTIKSDTRKFSKQDGSLYDETLITKLPVTEDKGHAIIIHLIGSHSNYIDRSPQEFKKFHFPNIQEHPNSVNEYCNSILYTDHVLKELFNTLQQNTSPDLIVYFSDHGERPGMGRDRFDWTMERIPLIIWTSDAYAAKYPDKIANLKTHLVQGFSNDMLFDTVLGLLSITSNHCSEKCDLSSPNYDFTMKSLLTEYGQYKIKDDPYLTKNIPLIY